MTPDQDIQIKTFGPPLAESPVVSVKMITYNHEPYIRQAIESVFAQDFDGPMELVIGEDCSTDNTRAIIEDVCRDAPIHVRLLTSERNVGIYANSARTQAACRGRYIALLEGDDYWIRSEKISRQFEAMEDFKSVDICFHPVETIDADGSSGPLFSYKGGSRFIYPVRNVILGDGGALPTPSIMVRAAVIHHIPLYLKRGDVADYFIQIWASARGGALYLPEPSSCYRICTPGSWTERMKDQQYEFEQFYGIATRLRLLEPHLQNVAKTYMWEMVIVYLERSLASSGCDAASADLIGKEIVQVRRTLNMERRKKRLRENFTTPVEFVRRAIFQVLRGAKSLLRPGSEMSKER